MLTLRRALGWTLALMVLSAGTIIGATAPAQAAPEVDCPGGWTEEYRNDLGDLLIVVRCPEGVGNNPGSGGGDEGGGNADPVGDRECTYGIYTVECQTSAGIWNGTCYVKVADPQPDKDHPVWAGHEDGDGVIIQCTAYDASLAEDCDADGGCPTGVSLQWAAGPPDEGPSPAELARRAVAQMDLDAGNVGITPNNGEPAIYGFPTWLWVDNPAENTTGPITTSASDGDLTVTATGTLDRIEYDMGDGGSVTCAGSDAPGTPYDPAYDPQGTTGADAAHSPTCGYMYSDTSAGQPGDAFTITATSYWTVEWSGGGQNGTIPIDLSTTRQHQVAEVQVILTTPDA